MSTISAFTTKYGCISRQLKNKVNLSYNGKTITVDAQWDTGATGTAISKDVVEKLSLVPTGKTTIETPSGSNDYNTYLVDVLLPNNVNISDAEVFDSEIGKQGIGVLIGMDIITLGDFSVSNYDGKTVFSFRTPSQQQTDYVRQALVQNKIGQKHGQGKRKKKK